MASRLEKRMDELLADETGTRLVKINVGHDAKFVVFSDLHRGQGDNADDFKNNNQATYNKALEYYLKEDFGLIHLGDIEELKENWSLKDVLEKSKIHLAKENEFHKKGKYFRVFGNHDSQYENENTVKKLLDPYFKGIKVYEGILLQFGIFPDIILVHGHQGYLPIITNLFEYIGLPIYKWWLNDVVKKSRSVYYESYCDIEKDENQFYSWVAKQKNTILIFGHTHRPLWGGKTVVENYEAKLKIKVEELKTISVINKVSITELKTNHMLYGVTSLIDEINAMISVIKSKMSEQGVCRAPKPFPLIFNTGCCIYKDGDITCLEIDKGELRLIKWGINESKTGIERKILEQEYLGNFILQ